MIRKIALLLTVVALSLTMQAQNAKRIVSLVPWVTKSLYVMGEQHRLVGCTNYCPVEADDKVAVISSAMSVNVEKIVLLKPDIVIASSLIKPETIDKLRSLGVKVIMQAYPESFEQICSSFIEISALVGQETKAREIINGQRARLQTIVKSIPHGSSPKIVIQIGANPLFIAVPNSFMDDYIRLAGGTNIGAALSLGNTTREFVLKQNPDAIFIVTMGVVADEEKQTWRRYASLSAAKSGRIFVLDADKSCSPTPILFVDTLEEMVQSLYYSNNKK